MKEFFEALVKRKSLFIIIVGVIVLLIGTAHEIKIASFSLLVTDVIGKWVITIVGISTMVFGAFLAYRESVTEYHPQQLGSDAKTLKPKHSFIFEEPIEFSGDKGNRFPISSDFLAWEKATILLWVKVPPMGQGLRDNKNNKYILSHITGSANERGWPYNNRFSLGRFYNSGYWALTISRNNADEEKEHTVGFIDNLDFGWHQFVISWDRPKKILEFMIEGNFRKKEFAQKEILNHWPVQLSGKVYVGSWAQDWENFYCDTYLYCLEIYDDFLDVDSNEVKKHKKKKPRS